MKKQIKTRITDPLLALFRFMENLIGNVLPFPVHMNYSTQGSFTAVNFDSIKDQTADEYVTVAQLSQRYPAFSQGSIRWLIFNMNSNGFNKVVRKIGRKVILNLREFKKFLEEKSQ